MRKPLLRGNSKKTRSPNRKRLTLLSAQSLTLRRHPLLTPLPKHPHHGKHFMIKERSEALEKRPVDKRAHHQNPDLKGLVYTKGRGKPKILHRFSPRVPDFLDTLPE
ncbi:hypothetical protein AMTR_s00028p00175480 [Amborella trichopoda]|uniref:Uncharacterized protein n=1 Tax=Amborella trichopoda TaxID=13333 RepID=W1PKT3_AMBTC|nr:hypothetical protein AMTR_s00028p00175480 [Amborella trichopoda]